MGFFNRFIKKNNANRNANRNARQNANIKTKENERQKSIQARRNALRANQQAIKIRDNSLQNVNRNKLRMLGLTTLNPKLKSNGTRESLPIKIPNKPEPLQKYIKDAINTQVGIFMMKGRNNKSMKTYPNIVNFLLKKKEERKPLTNYIAQPALQLRN